MQRFLFLIATATIWVIGESQSIIHPHSQATDQTEASQSSDNKFDFSGEWIDTNGRKWNISQHENKIIFVEIERKLGFQGILDGRIIRYATRVLLAQTRQKECEDFINTWFPYEAQIVLSEDGNKMEFKFPDRVSKGDCVLDMKNSPAFTFTKVNST